MIRFKSGLSLLIFVMLLSLTLLELDSATTSGKGRAKLAMRVINVICKHTSKFAETKKIQEAIMDSAQPEAPKDSSGPCQLIRWNQCDSSDKDCRKFEKGKCPSEPDNESTRIVGGVSVEPNELPYNVRITVKTSNSKNSFMCGGTLISAVYVLSAAHCFYDKNIQTPGNVIIYAGDHSILTTESTEQTRNPVSIRIHPNFSIKPILNDICILKVSPPFLLNKAVQPAHLPEVNYNAMGITWVSGWGRTLSTMKQVLQKAAIDVVHDDECKEMFLDMPAQPITSDMLCLDSSKKRGHCEGDSGGPVVMKAPPQKNIPWPWECYNVVGVISFGVECGRFTHPSVSMEVSKYIPWLHQIATHREPLSLNTLMSNLESTAEPHEFPFHVRIMRNRLNFCGGAILTREYVITAASCVSKEIASMLQVVAGDHSILDPENNEQERGVRTIIVHPHYDDITLKNDIALLRLTANLDLTQYVNVIDLATPEMSLEQGYSITGWGFFQESRNYSNHLQKFVARSIPLEKCALQYGCALNEGVMCVGVGIPTQDKQSICEGDHGGPLSLKLDSGKYILFGVGSFRLDCASGSYPVVFTLVPHFLPWIRHKVPRGASETVDLTQVPYHVLISISENASCSGVIINADYILTAASCFHNTNTEIITQNQVHLVQVFAGKLKLGADVNEQRRTVKRILTHEHYNPIHGLHNLALLELSEMLVLSETIRPAVLPSNDTWNETDGTLTSWDLEHHQESGTELQRITYSIMGYEECQNVNTSELDIRITHQMLCTEKLNADICIGDHGGPLTQPTDEISGCHTLLGIHSRKFPDCRKPSMYMFSFEYLDWMRRTIDSRVHNKTGGSSNRIVIVGGESAKENEFPYVAWLLIDGVRTHTCGAAIVNPNHVITSAYCLISDDADRIVVLAGSHIETGAFQQFAAMAVTFHEDYDPITQLHDIALIKVFSPGFNTSNPSIGFVSLPDPTFTPTGPNVVLGWGETDIAGKPTTVLQKVNMSLIPMNSCWNTYGCALYKSQYSVLCAEVKGGKPGSKPGICRGDHGGPMVQKQSNGTILLIGIASMRIGCKEAHTPSPSVFTHVAKYTNWIKTNIGAPNEAKRAELPHQVAISINETFKCSGTIINENHILTTASCMNNTSKAIQDELVNVTAGRRDLQVEELFDQYSVVRTMRVHEHYDPITGDHDIALLELIFPLLYSKNIQAAIIPIPTPDKTPQGGQGVLSGWRFAGTPAHSSTLQVTTAGIKTCDPANPDMLCIATIPTNCPIDSGSPMSQLAPKNCRIFVGMATSHCGAGTTSPRFLQPSKYRKWIQDNINASALVDNKILTKRSVSSRVVRASGGINAEPNEFPFMVRILKNGHTLCGGSIVSETYVVTSAQCVVSEVVSTISIMAGDHDVREKDDFEVVHPAAEFFVHEHFDKITKANDVAMIRVAKAFQFNEQVAALHVPLASFVVPPIGDYIALGWGRFGNDGESMTQKLQKVSMDMGDFNLCQRNYGCAVHNMDHSILCLSILNMTGGGICKGDLGGPLVMNISGTHHLMGIASFRSLCSGSRFASVFSKASFFSKWIRDKAAGGNSSKPIPTEDKISIGHFHAVLLKNNVPICSAAIVAPFWALTSASCIKEFPVINPSSYRIVMGLKHPMKSTTGPGAQNRVVISISVHPDYNETTGVANLAMIEMITTMFPTVNIKQAINVREPNEDAHDNFVTGWGLNSSMPPTTLHNARVSVYLKLQECRTAYTKVGSTVVVPDKVICTTETIPSICFGDQGSPLTQHVNKAGPFFGCFNVIGILSKFNDCTHPRLPSIYTDLSQYHQWIESHGTERSGEPVGATGCKKTWFSSYCWRYCTGSSGPWCYTGRGCKKYENSCAYNDKCGEISCEKGDPECVYNCKGLQ